MYTLTCTYECSDEQVSLPGLGVFAEELVDDAVELHQASVFPQVVLQQTVRHVTAHVTALSSHCAARKPYSRA